MNAKVLLCLSLALVVILTEVSGHRCTSCGLDGGKDVCGCSGAIFRAAKTPKVDHARPRVVCKKIGGVEDFKPIGDACGCGNVEVLPANLPAPRCRCPGKHIHHSRCSHGSDESDESYETYSRRPKYIRAPEYMHGFDESYSGDNSVVDDPNVKSSVEDILPVDAVSMNLVYGMRKQAETSKTDETLNYGFATLPAEKPVQKYKTDVPEEKMFTIQRRIVELRPRNAVVKCGNGPEEDIVVEDGNKPTAYLSYKDLGYVPEAGVNSKFVKKPCHRHHLRDSEEYVDDASYEHGKKYYKKRVYSDEDISDEGKDYKLEVKKYPGWHERSVMIKKIGGCGCGGH